METQQTNTLALAQEVVRQTQYGAKSVKDIVYHKTIKGQSLTPVQVAYIADDIINETKHQYAKLVANALGYDLRHKSEVNNYKFRQYHHIKIGVKAYALMPQTFKTAP